MGEAQGLHPEEGIIKALSIPECVSEDAAEIIFGLSEAAGEESVAFCYCDDVLYARIYDGERYVFPLPFMLTEDADAVRACIDLAAYSRRELIPLIITDVPRDEIEFLCSVFPHIDAYTYEDDDDTFYIKVNNECDMLDSIPSIELDGIVLDALTDEDKEKYAELCRDRDLNKHWGYDVDEDNPDGDSDFYLKVAEREFDDGVAITLAIREGGELVGEATIYDFDYVGSAEIAVRVLPTCHSRGIGSGATRALIKLSREIGLSSLRAEILEENESSIKMTSKYMELVKRENGKVYFALSL
ncbi:MAG: GNAT family N-acetyltransferase [Clostridia bacterium]|nr:GNAT family N-acetyltransferase [Clostridia bacterium]